MIINGYTLKGKNNTIINQFIKQHGKISNAYKMEKEQPFFGTTKKISEQLFRKWGTMEELHFILQISKYIKLISKLNRKKKENKQKINAIKIVKQTKICSTTIKQFTKLQRKIYPCHV